MKELFSGGRDQENKSKREKTLEASERKSMRNRTRWKVCQRMAKIEQARERIRGGKERGRDVM